MKNIRKDIKENRIKRAYLIFGEEKYLVRSCKNLLIKSLVAEGDNMNYTKYAGKECEPSKVISMSDTLPFFADKRVVLVQDSMWFKNACDDMASYMKNIPESTCIIFVESEVDKRSKVYKQLKEVGYVCECNRASEKELQTWVVKILSGAGKKITAADMTYFLEKVGDDMDNIYSELEKLIPYTSGREVITREDIDAVCISEITGKIFDMIDAIGNKNQKKAMNLYYDLIAVREAPMRILYMISRQFNIMLQIKEMSEMRAGVDEIAEKLGMRSFIVKKSLVQCRNFSLKTIRRALKYCMELEHDVKLGKLNDHMAVELVIVKYSNR